MTSFFQFVVIGLGTGAVYALLALGVVVIHRASGIVNFAQGGVAVFAGFVFSTLTAHLNLGWGLAFFVVTCGAALFGAVIYWSAIRPLRSYSQLTQGMMTLAILVTLEALAILIWGNDVTIVLPYLPTKVYLIGGVTIQLSQCILLALACLSTAALWAVSKFTLPGLAIRGTAENRRAVATLGWSPDTLAMVSWMGGCALGAAAGMLIAPITELQVNSMSLLLVATLAAALVGSFSSFPLTLAGALGLGIGQALLVRYGTSITGAPEAFPFFAIVALLVIRGHGLQARGRVAEHMAAIGSGAARPRVVIPALVITAALMQWVFGIGFASAVMQSLMFGVVLLSVVLLTGYTGQLSLAQMSLAGVGALAAARFAHAGWPLPLAALIGVVIASAAGLVFAIPALRTRGMTLAMVTFGLGSTITVMVFNNASLVGGTVGTPVAGSQSLFGWNINASLYPRRYALVVLVAFALCAMMVANVRRGRVGRRLIAVRSNERAAAALGINVYAIKLYAFGLAAAIAGVGGILLAFQYPYVQYDPYGSFQSLLAVAYTVLGGVGYVAGALYGAVFAPSGVGAWVLNLFGSSAIDYLALVGGVSLIAILLYAPNGMVQVLGRQTAALASRFRPSRAPKSTLPDSTPVQVAPATLEIRDLVVRFGGVTAVDGVNMTLEPGRISGLIGPNGAGKTTVIDAATGLVRAAGGGIFLSGEDITRTPMHVRARAGLSRSFQSLELFEGVSVRENLLAAAEPRDYRAFVADLIWPGRQVLTPAAVAAIREFKLEQDLDRKPSELSYGRRRLVAIARAVASEPSVLLLDEPGAGLDDREVTEIAALVRQLATTWGIAVLLVEHDMNFVMSVCDDITVVEFGKQIAHGAPEEIRADPAVIAAYLGTPQSPGEQRALATPEVAQ